MQLSRADTHVACSRLPPSKRVFALRYSHLFHKHPAFEHALDNKFLKDTFNRLLHGLPATGPSQEIMYPVMERALQLRMKARQTEPQKNPLRSFSSFVAARCANHAEIRAAVASVIHTFLRNGFPLQKRSLDEGASQNLLAAFFGTTKTSQEHMCKVLRMKNCRVDAHLFVMIQTAMAELVFADASQYGSASARSQSKAFYDSVREKCDLVIQKMNAESMDLFTHKRRDMDIVNAVCKDILASPRVYCDPLSFSAKLQRDLFYTCLTSRRVGSTSSRSFDANCYSLLKKTPYRAQYDFAMLLHVTRNHALIPLYLLFTLLTRNASRKALMRYVCTQNPDALARFHSDEALFVFNFLSMRRIQLEQVIYIPVPHDERDRVKRALERRFATHDDASFYALVDRATTLVACPVCQTVLTFHRNNNQCRTENEHRYGVCDVDIREGVPVCCERNKNLKCAYDIHAVKVRRRSKTIPRCVPCMEMRMFNRKEDEVYKVSWFSKLFRICDVCGCIHDDAVVCCSVLGDEGKAVEAGGGEQVVP